MKPLKIYLGDLTYDTISLSTEAFPLNIGYIASYCNDRFGLAVNITLFKYIEDLDRAINDSPPDILGLSNYCWNQRVDIEMFRMLLQRNPDALTVWGGPNFPLDIASQEEFLNQNKEVDIYVPIDGETGFYNIVERVLEADSKEKIKAKVLENPIEGCISRNSEGKIQYKNPVIRIKNLDEVPSPYLSGLMDEFFDGKLSPMLQTNRGCPFSCTFCVDGTDLVNQVNQFSLERVYSDIKYIATHVPQNTHNLMISDLNFGMMPRDLEICDYIVDTRQKYGYPEQVHATTGKNKKERIIEAIKRLSGSLRIWMSVQSMDEEVLRNIRRDNISTEHMIALGPSLKKTNLRTFSEVILGLPGESYDSHVSTIRQLVSANMDSIQVYTCMMLPGSELNTPEQREKWGLKTKFRILPRDFAKLSNGKKVIEIEEVSIGSNTLTFEEYVELRQLAFSMVVTNVGIVYDALLKFLRERNVDVFELFYKMMKYADKAPLGVREAFHHFKEATNNELWDSPEEILEHYQNEDEYQKLLRGDEGINVLQYHHALITAAHMDEWTEYLLEIAYGLLKEKEEINKQVEEQFHDVANYCRGFSHNPLGKDRMFANPIFEFHFDIKKWLEDENDFSLSSFKFTSPTTISFQLTKGQYKHVEDELMVFGDTPVGRGQVVKGCYNNNLRLWRYPIIQTVP